MKSTLNHVLEDFIDKHWFGYWFGALRRFGLTLNLWHECFPQWTYAWWRHQMEALSALLAICAGNSPVPVTQSFDVSLICTQMNGWVNNGVAGDVKRNRDHYDVIVMDIITYPCPKLGQSILEKGTPAVNYACNRFPNQGPLSIYASAQPMKEDFVYVSSSCIGGDLSKP